MTALAESGNFATFVGNQDLVTDRGNGHTKGHKDCPICNAARFERLDAAIPANVMFPQAAEIWLNSRRFANQNKKAKSRYISDRTLHDYEVCIRSLGGFFGQLRLNEIHGGHLRTYQEERSATCGANKITYEVNTLRVIMRRAGAWTDELENSYQPLQHEESDIAQAMTPTQQEVFLKVAESREEWSLVLWFSTLALHTTMSNCEVRGLKLDDINLFDNVVLVRKASAKNKHRIRTIPLDEEALWACRMIVQRAHSLGSGSPSHYAFPLREKRGTWNPCKPMTVSGIKKPFQAVRKEAGVTWLRIHDLRHCAITRLAEAGTPWPVIKSMAGHVSQRMTDHYTHISNQSKRAALESAYPKGKPRGTAPAQFPRNRAAIAFVPAWQEAAGK